MMRITQQIIVLLQQYHDMITLIPISLVYKEIIIKKSYAS